MDFMPLPSADVLGVLIAIFSVTATAIAAASSYYFLSRKPKGVVLHLLVHVLGHVLCLSWMVMLFFLAFRLLGPSEIQRIQAN
jgi:uncharacterized membrane protein